MNSRTSILLTLLLAFGLRVFRLDHQELRGDEAFGYFFSLRSLESIVQATLELREPHPVASYWFQHVWLGQTGPSEFALRFPGVCFSLLAVALLYRLARRLDLAPVTAGMGALLLAISPYAIWHSQDARMYNMSMALTLASTVLMVEALQRGRRRFWLAYLLVTWVALHTHYFAIFIVAAQNLFVLGRAVSIRRTWATTGQWLQIQVVLAFFYLPWLLTAQDTLTGYGGNGDSPAFGEMVRRTLATLLGGESIPPGWHIVYTGLACLILFLVFLNARQWNAGGRRAFWLLLLLWTVPVLATWVSSFSRPIFNERYLIAAAPAFYLLLAVGLVQRGPFIGYRTLHPVLPFVLLILVFTGTSYALANHYFDPAYSKTRGWRELAAALERFTIGPPPAVVRIVQNYPDPTLDYYDAGAVGILSLPPRAHDAGATAVEVEKLVTSGVQRVVLAEQSNPQWDATGIAATALAQHYTRIWEEQVAGWWVQTYAHPPTELSPVDATFQNSIELVAAAVEPQHLVPGGLLAVHLRWTGAPDALAGSEKIFLHLLNAAGEIVAQTDRPFALQPMALPVHSYGILLPETLSDETHRLIAGLYDPARTGAPRLHTLTGADTLELVNLPLAEDETRD